MNVVLVFAGTDQQYDNFVHLFGDDEDHPFRRIVSVQDIRDLGIKRPLVLFIGTWYELQQGPVVITYCKQHGQAFTKIGLADATDPARKKK